MNPQLRIKQFQLHRFFASMFLWQNMPLFMKWLETSTPLLITPNITAVQVTPMYNTQECCGTRSKAIWLQRYLQSVSHRVFSEIYNCPRLGHLYFNRILLEISNKRLLRQLRQSFNALFQWHSHRNLTLTLHITYFSISENGKREEVLWFHKNNGRERLSVEPSMHLFVPSATGNIT